MTGILLEADNRQTPAATFQIVEFTFQILYKVYMFIIGVELPNSSNKPVAFNT